MGPKRKEKEKKSEGEINRSNAFLDVEIIMCLTLVFSPGAVS